MLHYRNIKTGIEITTSCKISGPDFEEIKTETVASKIEPEPALEAAPKAPKKAAKPVKRVKK